MIVRVRFLLLSVAVAVVLCGTVAISAKRISGVSLKRYPHVSNQAVKDSYAWTPAGIEQRLRAFFTVKAQREDIAGVPGYIEVPSRKDLFAIAAQWDGLSPSFKRLYKKAAAAAIPVDSQSFISPGGHFYIIYTTNDTTLAQDAIDSTDTLGYDTANWRRKIQGPNGVPDYIDELAFALDSSWSMEVERFGFSAPQSSFETIRAQQRYAVVVRNLHLRGFYAFSYPGNVTDDDGIGFPSYIEMRHDWREPEFAPMGYDTAYEKALQVTAAHEFFHSIQYSMVHSYGHNGILLDDFPVSWTEGTAVMMEDLAFDSVDDFVQYSFSYFNDPTRALFNDAYDDYGSYVYSHSLISLFAYKMLGGIDFFHHVYLNNQAQRTGFVRNIETAVPLADSGYSWSDILGRFHAESFFTGSRVDSAFFIAEANELKQWQVATAKRDVWYADTVKPYGMQSYMLTPDETDPDSLVIYYGSQESKALPRDSLWRYHLIGSSDGGDTIISLPGMRSYGQDSVVIASWKGYEHVVFCASNGNGTSSRAHYFSFFGGNEVYPEKKPAISEELVVYPNPLPSNGSLFISAQDFSQTYSSVSLRTLSGVCIATTRIGGHKGTLSGSQWRWSEGRSRDILEWSVELREKNPAAGTYLLLLQGSGKTIARKVLIQQ